MNKYYTPTIEEFHVEFEYFENQKKDKFYLSDDIYKMQKKIRSGFIKIKYLDREDIESFGFIYDKTSSTEGQLKFFKNNLCLFYRPKSRELGTFTIDPAKSDFFSVLAWLPKRSILGRNRN